MAIKDIILLQKREIEGKLKEKYVERVSELRNPESNIIKVITGPRRAGKSVFAAHALQKIGNFGYANFDDEKLVEAKNYDEIITAINALYVNPKYLFLDEIQNLPKWELFVNRLQRQGYNLVISGSNSNMLSFELATHLTGRHSNTLIFPFSFREFLKLENKELTEPENREKLLSYLTTGGYPEQLVKNLDYKDYLSTLLTSVLYKDIVKRFRIRSPKGIEDLATYLISNTAKEFSYNTLAKVTACKSVHTVQKYLGYLEETFILFTLNRFSFKLKEQMTSNKKIYCIDTGFISAKAFSFLSDYSRLYENAVASELKRLEIEGKINLYFWKSEKQEEVDFLVKEGRRIKQLIQVCYDMTDPKTKEREIRSLLKAGKELKCENLLVITDDKEGEETANWFGLSGTIKYIPLWKWLLEAVKFSE